MLKNLMKSSRVVYLSLLPTHLAEVVQGCMQTGIHASGGLTGDLDGVLEDASGDDMLLRVWCWLAGDEHPEGWVTVCDFCLQQSIKRGEPAGHQVHILDKGMHTTCYRSDKQYFQKTPLCFNPISLKKKLQCFKKIMKMPLKVDKKEIEILIEITKSCTAHLVSFFYSVKNYA